MTCLSVQLQPLTTDDLPQVLALDQACFGGLWSKDGYLREMASPNSTLLILPLPNNGDRLMGLGCLWSIVEEAHVTIMAVHPDFQGQGLGQYILLGLLRDAWLRGLERATLEVRDSNTAAIALYEKFGFQTAGRRKGYYKATGEDALIMWRKGLDHPQFPEQLEQWGKIVGDRLSQHAWKWE
ncbi:(SSU ribosomal protein S18P)-alanine acetyltransferase [[Leptolyngbya] sp. PCC 7376]|uniref:ribosomal protein S18-alanine N-acetyltransferase n=1 Tax=[Leptolyngbya] sp. PCC 7376 TaxID=111781 RepID=UPI00029F0E07|nr:ribosomal protein S18-alanine N-acetyltransferase [[Leptolyngbya] sp. PCC 7376]AFY40606.1 (SSU ribosomal protein S18P)-alanine acetyltransferase [[Leptolyngbya] sp. PCC 7376]